MAIKSLELVNALHDPLINSYHDPPGSRNSFGGVGSQLFNTW